MIYKANFILQQNFNSIPSPSYNDPQNVYIPLRAIKEFVILFDLTSKNGSSKIIDYNTTFSKNITFFYYGPFLESRNFYLPYNHNYQESDIFSMNKLLLMATRYITSVEFNDIVSIRNIYYQRLQTAIHNVEQSNFLHGHTMRFKLLKRQKASGSIIDIAKANLGPHSFSILAKMDGSILDPYDADSSLYVILYYCDASQNIEDEDKVNKAFYSKAHVFNIEIPAQIDILDFII